MVDDDRADEELLQAVVAHLLTSGDLDEVCDDAELPHLTQPTAPRWRSPPPRSTGTRGVLTLNRGVWLELSDGSVFGLTVPCRALRLRLAAELALQRSTTASRVGRPDGVRTCRQADIRS